MLGEDARVVAGIKGDHAALRPSYTRLGKVTDEVSVGVLRLLVVHVDVVAPRASDAWLHLDSINKVFAYKKHGRPDLPVPLIWIGERALFFGPREDRKKVTADTEFDLDEQQLKKELAGMVIAPLDKCAPEAMII